MYAFVIIPSHHHAHQPSLDVAEDNIKPLLNVSEEMFEDFHRTISVLPRYFTGVHMAHEGNTSRGRFFLSPELLHAYPEDDDIGRTWVEQIEPF